MFNTLHYAKMLEEVGFSREQAETSIKILVEIMEDKLASKHDLKEMKLASAQEFKEFRLASENDFKEFRLASAQDFKEFKIEIQHSMQQLESRLTIKMGTMLAAFVAILTAIQKLV